MHTTTAYSPQPYAPADELPWLPQHDTPTHQRMNCPGSHSMPHLCTSGRTALAPTACHTIPADELPWLPQHGTPTHQRMNCPGSHSMPYLWKVSKCVRPRMLLPARESSSSVPGLLFMPVHLLGPVAYCVVEPGNLQTGRQGRTGWAIQQVREPDREARGG